MKRLVRPLLFAGVPLLLAAGIRVAPLLAQDAVPPAARPTPAATPAPAAEPPAARPAEGRGTERPPADEDIAPEAGPGDRISADNNVSFPVDI